MKLFQYEMKKLLINKKGLILLSVFFIIYVGLGFLPTMSDNGLSVEQNKKITSEYMRLVEENSGQLSKELLKQSTDSVQSATAEFHGDNLSRQISKNPELKFYFQYVEFGQQVDRYWNGPEDQDKDNILGVYPIQEKLRELEAANQQNSYQYKYYQNRLATEHALGEPILENIDFWNYFSLLFDPMFLLLLLLLPMTFFISPLFTQEVKTEMDSILLCSVKGRREIVSAKLFTVGLTSAIIALLYILGYFIGTFLGTGDFSGFGAPARCLSILSGTSLKMTVGGIMTLGVLWLVFVCVIFGLALGLISSLLKNQSAAFGLGIVVLIAGTMSGNLQGTARKILWPVAEFNFGILAQYGTIFGGTKSYNVFGIPVSYSTVAFMVCLALSTITVLLTYQAQKRRSVV